MNITIKTISNQKFPLADVSPESTVAELKERIAAELDIGGTVKKLIFSGKALKKDESTVAECGLESGSELVCLVRKSPKKKAEPPKKPETQLAPPEQKPSEPSTAVDKPYTIAPADVQKLCQMGFPPQMVVMALKAAYGEVEVATQYLIAGGIPADRALVIQKEIEALQAQQPQQQQATAATGAYSGPQGMDSRFETMLGNPQAMAQILSNPAIQQECLRMMAQEKPELYQRFVANPAEVGEEEEFQKTMFHILRKSFSAKPKQQVRRIQLTAEDKANLQQLMTEKSLPSIQHAVQIYMKNGKDLEKSMAFCDRLMEQAMAQAGAAPATQDAAERQPLGPRDDDGNVDPPAEGTDPSKPSGAQVRPEDTVLTISPDMLLDDDEE